MGDDKAIVPVEHVNLGALAVPPDAVVERATIIATSLAKVIKDRRLYKEIQGKAHVYVEGWSTLGAIVGVLPREKETKELPDGSYEAHVELVRTSDGAVIGGASAVCGMDEPKWADKPKYARRSMAITRATGKAYRLGFAWIMKLAGYEATPAEEMDVVEGEVREVAVSSKPAREKPERPLTPTILSSFLAKKAAGYSSKNASPQQLGLAMGMLNECFAGDEAADEKRHSVLAYLFGIESGKECASSQVLALLDWLKPEKDSGGAYFPDPMAVKEAQAVVRARMIDLGNEELFPQ